MENPVYITMEKLGLMGIALLMFLETVLPPITSELIMPLAGYLATRRDMNIFCRHCGRSHGCLWLARD